MHPVLGFLSAFTETAPTKEKEEQKLSAE